MIIDQEKKLFKNLPICTRLLGCIMTSYKPSFISLYVRFDLSRYGNTYTSHSTSVESLYSIFEIHLL